MTSATIWVLLALGASAEEWSALPDFEPQPELITPQQAWKPIKPTSTGSTLESTLSSFPLHVIDSLKDRASGQNNREDNMPPAVKKRQNKLYYCTQSIQRGDHRTLYRMLQLDPTLVSENIQGQTLLHVAALHGNPAATDILLQAGADPRGSPPDEAAAEQDTPNPMAAHTPLSLALVGHHCAGCSLFDVCSPEQLETMNRTQGAHIAVIQRLVASASAPHLLTDNAVDVLFNGGSHQPIDMFFSSSGQRLSKAVSGQGVSALHFVLGLVPQLMRAWAYATLNTHSVDRLANECGHFAWTGLRDARERGWISWSDLSRVLEPSMTRLVHSLAKAGADVDLASAAGVTPCHLAAVHGLQSPTDVLVSAGALCDVPGPDGLTALQLAVLRGSASAVRELLGADPAPAVDVVGNERSGRTALHLALHSHRLDIAALLVQHGASTEAEDTQGHTACDYGELGKTICTRDWEAAPWKEGVDPSWVGWTSRRVGCGNHSEELGWDSTVLEEWDSDQCTIATVEAADMTKERFSTDLLEGAIPFMIRGAAANATALWKWSKEHLESSVSARLHAVPMSGATAPTGSQQMSVPRFIDRHWGEGDRPLHLSVPVNISTTGWVLSETLVVREDWMSAEPGETKLVLGPRASGSPMRWEALHTNHMLAAGRKRWGFLSPEQAVWSNLHPMDAPEQHDLRAMQQHCVQVPGDVLFVPPGWGVTSLHVQDSVSVFQEFKPMIRG